MGKHAKKDINKSHESGAEVAGSKPRGQKLVKKSDNAKLQRREEIGARPDAQVLRKEMSRARIEANMYGERQGDIDTHIATHDLNLSGEHQVMPAITDTGTPVTTPELERFLHQRKSQAKMGQILGVPDAEGASLSSAKIATVNQETVVNGLEKVAKAASRDRSGCMNKQDSRYFSYL